MKRAIFILATLFIAFVGTGCNEGKKEIVDIVIPFGFVKNQIVVDVFIDENGPYSMIFDTGVTPSTIDIEIAKRLTLGIDSSQVGFAVGRGSDEIQLMPVQINNLRLHGLQVDRLDAVTLDHKFLGERLGKPLHGILGHSLLKGKIFKIDYQNKEIQFFDSRESLDKTLQNENSIKERFVFQSGDIIPILENLKINDHPFIASLDTGSSLNVEIYEHHFDTYQIEIDTTKTYQITGAQGKAENVHVLIDKFSLADKVFQNIEGGVATVKNKSQLRQGNIGNRFLSQFKVSFDYVNKEVIFEF